MKLLSEIDLKTSEKDFYKRQSLLLDSKPQDWVINQYKDLERIGIELGGINSDE